MNQKIKYIGLLAILPLAMVALAPELVDDAYAQKAAPVVKIVSVNNFSGESENTFNAIFQLSAGNENVEDVLIVIESDRDIILTTVNSLFAQDSSINSVKIQALDPTSITATIVHYQINN